MEHQVKELLSSFYSKMEDKVKYEQGNGQVFRGFVKEDYDDEKEDQVKEKDLLEFCREWQKLDSINNFIEKWLLHDKTEERLSIYKQLCRLGDNYCMTDIETMIYCALCLWDDVQKYEKKNPQKPKIKTMAEADKLYQA